MKSQQNLSNDAKRRYARQISLPDFGELSQEILLKGHVLVIGAGGLGAPLLYYLAAAGVGHITIADGDEVNLSNLNRQILFETADIGDNKASAAQEKLHDLNPDITYDIIPKNLSGDALLEAAKQADIIADGSDNITTRYAVNDAAIHTKTPLISAAVHQMQGQVAVFKGYEPDQPCYRCLYPNITEGDMPNCSEAGILGAVAGVMGSLQAQLVVETLLGHDKSGVLYRYHNYCMSHTALIKDPECKSC